MFISRNLQGTMETVPSLKGGPEENCALGPILEEQSGCLRDEASLQLRCSELLNSRLLGARQRKSGDRQNGHCALGERFLFAPDWRKEQVGEC